MRYTYIKTKHHFVSYGWRLLQWNDNESCTYPNVLEQIVLEVNGNIDLRWL